MAEALFPRPGDRLQEIELPASELPFSEMLDTIGEAVYAVDRQERFLFANRKAFEMWGKRSDEVIGRRILEIFPDIEGSEAYRAYQEVIATRSPAHLEIQGLALDRRWIGLDVYPMPGGGLIVAFRDLEQRRRTEAALRHSEVRFRTMLEALPHIAFVIRGGGTAEYYNQRFTEYTGSAIGADPTARLSLLHPEDQARFVAARAAGVSSNEEYIVEARIRRRDGVFRWHLIHNKPIEMDGSTVAWLGTAVDIDDIRRANELLEQRVATRTAELREANIALMREIEERKRTEAVLKESEERHRKLYNRTPMALQSVDAEARLIDVNDHWLELFGYRRHEVLGRSPPEFMTEESANRYRENAWPEMLRSRGLAREVEYRFLKSSGEIFDGRLSACGEFDAAGRFIRSWSVVADITAQKQAEAQLIQAQKIEAVGQLTSGVAHDFNNLLTAIAGNLELLATRIDDADGTAVRLIVAAQRAAERGARLTAQLLAFSRKQHMDLSRVDLNHLVAGLDGLLESTIGGTVRIEMQLFDGLWPALADPGQIELVLLNLAINARDAMPTGGTITIETANTVLGPPRRAEEPPAGEYVMVSVADTGTGISPPILDKIFEPFFTTKEIGKGSGLGLSQVLGVAQQLGGGVGIDTRLGAGTVVKIYLPRASDIDLGSLNAALAGDLERAGAECAGARDSAG
jgi:PAS domain S-box-containing protein